MLEAFYALLFLTTITWKAYLDDQWISRIKGGKDEKI
jgi:hypothetical protein